MKKAVRLIKMVLIDNRQSKFEYSEEMNDIICRIIDYVLEDEIVKIPAEISLVLVDNEGIRDLNREFRNIDRATDVLSFPMLNYPEGKVYKDVYSNYTFDKCDLDGNCLVLGDIALSLERAEEQRREYGHSFLREVAYLVVHSMLHLLGYDHMEADEKAVMRKREEEILKKFSIGRE